MTCAEIVTELRKIISALNPLTLLSSIDSSLKVLTAKEPVFIDTHDGWSRARTAGKVEYQKVITLSGAAENIDLNIGQPIQLNRIELFFNDATAKSYAVQVFSGNLTSYVELLSVLLDTNIPTLIQCGLEYNYIMMPIRIRIAVSASTAGKIMTVKVQTEDV